MTLHLHNTLARRKAPFTPIDPANVRLYVCGPTVYDHAHIGNARPAVVFDVLNRLLRHLYGDAHVTFVSNITDIDDKIIARAAETGEPIEQLTRRTEARYFADMDALNVRRPDIAPRATDHLPEMIAMIETLIGRGHAYPAEGHVLFSVPSMADYGRLSGRNRDELIAGARVEVAPYKRDPADFVLWKPSSADQPGWDSPWGRGRPGWHLECSAMSERYLGETFDIHGGGQDLIFPHHENEIAQSRCAHPDAEFARVWLHNGFLMAEGEKMAKSAGNFYTVHELLRDGWPGEVIRMVLLKTHYRQPLDFTISALRQAQSELRSFYTTLRIAQDIPAAASDVPDAVLASLTDDLNTPDAIHFMHEIRHDLNQVTQSGRGDGETLKGALLAAANLLGLLQVSPDTWLKGEHSDAETDAIERRIAERAAARKAKDFAEADRIRDALAADGIVLEDGPGGTTWRRQD